MTSLKTAAKETKHVQAQTYRGLVLALLMRLLAYSATALGNAVFYLPFTKKRVAFPDWLNTFTCNSMTSPCKNHTATDKLMGRYPLIAYNEIEMFL